MSKSNCKCKSTLPQNHLKFEELELREREAGLARGQIDVVQAKMECSRRNIEALCRLDIANGLKHESLNKEVLAAIKSNLDVLVIK